MRRTLLFVLICTCLLWGAGALLAEPASQDGLPPDLTIASKPAYQEQLQALRTLDATAGKQRPTGGGGGLFGGLRRLLGGGGGGEVQALPCTPEALALAGAAMRGKPVALSGVYQPTGKETALLPYDGGAINLSVPATVPLTEFGTAGPSGLPVTVEGVVEVAGSIPQVRVTTLRVDPVLSALRLARLQELLNDPAGAQKTYDEAYKRATAFRSPYAAFAKVSAGRLAYDLREFKTARQHLSSAWNPFVGSDKQGRPLHYVWYPTADGKGWEKLGAAKAIGKPLDTLNRSDFWYRFMEFFVLLAGGQRWLGIVFLAIISRVIIWPLTKKQLDSAEAMKRLQPQIKALQDRYVDDKQKFQTEFWSLCQQNGVNPLGGCLPMLVQMPVLIFLWQGIRNYIVQFDGHPFLWVHNLAAPDYGLLVAYTISMIFFQKMTQKLQPTPTMNPQQAQQQQMMTYMMPLMFFFFFQTFPAAFLLYWLATNVVYFAQQYGYTRGVERRKASGEGTESLVPGKPKTGGFAGAMAKMMSLKAEEEEPTPESKSFHEKEAQSRGKKTGKPAEKPGSTKRK